MKFNEYDYHIGMWAVAAIENDDRAGLTDTGEIALDAFLATLPFGGRWVWGEGDEEDFTLCLTFAKDEITGLFTAVVKAKYMVPV